MCGRFRQMAGVLLVLSGVLIVFLCLPMEFFLIALGVALAGCCFCGEREEEKRWA